ncbi:hypothetical protein CU254_33970 [Amycolatopsis sp. AA4]|nr:hypothetical protein CU254_33970 [Amycolatopsis sp. AA4]
MALGACDAPKVAFGACSAPNVAFGACSAPNVAFGASSAPKVAFGAWDATNVALGRRGHPGERDIKRQPTLSGVVSAPRSGLYLLESAFSATRPEVCREEVPVQGRAWGDRARARRGGSARAGRGESRAQ